MARASNPPGAPTATPLPQETGTPVDVDAVVRAIRAAAIG
jgi:hypothetical protein